MEYYTFITFVSSIIVTEALTELLVKSEFFKPLRAWLFNNKSNILSKFIHTVLDCGYCTSIWVAFFVSIYLIDISSIFINVGWFVAWLVVHRLSNLLHFCIDRVHGL